MARLLSIVLVFLLVSALLMDCEARQRQRKRRPPRYCCYPRTCIVGGRLPCCRGKICVRRGSSRTYGFCRGNPCPKGKRGKAEGSHPNAREEEEDMELPSYDALDAFYNP